MIVLAFVVLLTGLIVAYFSRTMTDRQLSNSSFNQSSADAMAKSALDIITSDLKQELLQSGTASVSGNTTLYLNTEISPVRNGTPPLVSYTGAIPMFMGSGTYPLPTLLRTSSGSAIPSPGIDHTASLNASSAAVSANGRNVSPARWNQHYLLPRQTGSSTALDPTPVSSGSTGFTPPSWVYVTGTGGPAVPPLTSPTNSVIGRYAYAIYDEGALLDMNAAGYPCINSGTAPYVSGTAQQALYGGKGALAFANLAVLSSGSGLPTLSTTNVNSIVGWRNYATLNSAGVDIGAFPAFTTLPTSGTGTQAKYYSVVTSNTNGLLQVSGTAYNNQTDQAFLSRQQLINLMTRSSITTTPGTSLAALQNALQYMGTFSRAVTGPSWSPTSDAGNMTNPAPYPAATGSNGGLNIYAYKTNAETAGSINRDLANVRFPTAGVTIVHYNDDGTTTSYKVQIGDPYLQHRFSLARIGWLTHTGPASGMTQAVKDCFGLQWGQDAYGNPCWMYIHGTISNQIVAQTGGGTTTGNQILTLNQVAALGREPDFFELLKAGILNGSLGRDPGPTNVTVSNHGVAQGCGGMSFDVISNKPDAQIIQIGANIIDQYDSDSYPTAIFFQGNNFDNITVPENGPLNVFYGVENLPYLYEMRPITWYRQDPTYYGYNSWYQPELWTPFQTPIVMTNRPSSFMVQAYGTVQLRIGSSSGIVRYEKLSDPWSYDSPRADGGYQEESTLYFKDPVSITGTSVFANPGILTLANIDTNQAPGTSIDMASINVAPSGAGGPTNPYDSNPSYNPFLAIHTGFSPYQITALSTAPDHNSTWVKDVSAGGFVDVKIIPAAPAPPLNNQKGVTFCLKYYDTASGKYLPYNYLSRWLDVFSHSWSVAGTGAPTDKVWGSSATSTTPIMRVDPRTDRFSATTIDSSHAPGFHVINQTWQNASAPGSPGEADLPWPVTGGFYYNDNNGGCTNGVPNWPSPPTQGYYWAISSYIGAWAQNTPLGANEAYYADPDGIVRPGNDCLFTNGTTKDGLSQVLNGYSVTTGTGANAAHTMGRRPIVLNRPFRSVGELGHAYRDLPFKNLDFFTSYSADSALLDIFSVTDQPSVVAGQINPNNAPAPVLQAILSGAGKQEADPTYNLNAEITTTGSNIAASIAGCLEVNQIGSRADLVNKLGVVMAVTSGTSLPVSSGTTSVIRNGFSASTNKLGDQADKAYLEAPVRALADVTNTRTWNLMIDVIAQTGNFPQNATNLTTNFVVQGERRYWLHIAIDRFTGKVVDQQLEPVYE